LLNDIYGTSPPSFFNLTSESDKKTPSLFVICLTPAIEEVLGLAQMMSAKDFRSL
jgi:hypothetical protein